MIITKFPVGADIVLRMDERGDYKWPGTKDHSITWNAALAYVHKQREEDVGRLVDAAENSATFIEKRHNMGPKVRANRRIAVLTTLRAALLLFTKELES